MTLKQFGLILLLNITLVSAKAQDWMSIKDTTDPVVVLTSEFNNPYRQPLAGMGWEDGLHISENGLYLYCTYVPIDFLSFALNGGLPNNFSTDYLRGADEFGMDLMTNPIGADEWLHSDILYASRASTEDAFEEWVLSDMERLFYSEGAPTPLFDGETVMWMSFTSNDNPTNNMDIFIIEDTEANPSGIGTAIASPITTDYNEDNPHITQLGGDSLILFFFFDNRPGGLGDIDIWYSISEDDGVSWNEPVNPSSLNSTEKEHQPFLHFDQQKEVWFLYYSAVDEESGKLAIFRKEQSAENNWDNWEEAELVISAGNSAGIGEPTLTQNGDLSFVVVYEDPELNSIYDRFDSDPWMAERKDFSNLSSEKESQIQLYPNPAKDLLHLKTQKSIERLQILNSTGQVVHQQTQDFSQIQIDHLPAGFYHLKLISDEVMTLPFVKN